MEPPGDGELTDLDEVSTKLDLARAYLDMGDPDACLSRFSSYDLHSGTHIDAPLHFAPSGVDVGQLKLAAIPAGAANDPLLAAARSAAKDVDAVVAEADEALDHVLLFRVEGFEEPEQFFVVSAVPPQSRTTSIDSTAVHWLAIPQLGPAVEPIVSGIAGS